MMNLHHPSKKIIMKQKKPASKKKKPKLIPVSPSKSILRFFNKQDQVVLTKSRDGHRNDILHLHRESSEDLTPPPAPPQPRTR